MATSQSLTEGLPPSEKPSFADMVRGTSNISREPFKEAAMHKGEPALLFSEQEVDVLCAPLRFALIGKFATDRPSMEFLRRGFKTIGFKGDFRLGLMDPMHILIRFDLEEDYHRCWLHNSWRFKDHVMKVLKWTPDFSAKEEPPLVPVWVSFDQLPLFLFARSPLFSLGRILGTPLKLDAPTISLSRPSVARICVELDLRNPLPSRIWIGFGKGGFWQPITYENLPDYCFDCHSLGHSQPDCGKQITLDPKAKQIWRVKPSQPPPLNPSQSPQVALEQLQPPTDSPVLENQYTPTDSPQHPPEQLMIPAHSSGLLPSEKALIPEHNSATSPQSPQAALMQQLPSIPSQPIASPVLDTLRQSTAVSTVLPPLPIVSSLAPVVSAPGIEFTFRGAPSAVVSTPDESVGFPTSTASADTLIVTAATTVPITSAQQLQPDPLLVAQPIVTPQQSPATSAPLHVAAIPITTALPTSDVILETSLLPPVIVVPHATVPVAMPASEPNVHPTDKPLISKEVGFTKQVVEELFSEAEPDADNDPLEIAHSSVPMLNKLKLIPDPSNFSAGKRILIDKTRADILEDLRHSSQQLNHIFEQRSLAKHATIMATSPLVDQTEMVMDDSMNLTDITVLVDEDDFIPVQKKKRGRPRKTVRN